VGSMMVLAARADARPKTDVAIKWPAS
jgi:hypothetical protein